MAIPSADDTTTSSWSSLGLIGPRVSSEMIVELILRKYSRQCELAVGTLPPLLCTPPLCERCWAEAPVKIARMTLTIKLDGNWSSFQLANNTPPLSVTGSVIAPSARMLPRQGPGDHQESNRNTPLFQPPGLPAAATAASSRSSSSSSTSSNSNSSSSSSSSSNSSNTCNRKLF